MPIQKNDNLKPSAAPEYVNNRSSFFKVYNDGIGFKNYSIRLSNFSFKNIPYNFIRAMSWVASLKSISALMWNITTQDEGHYLMIGDCHGYRGRNVHELDTFSRFDTIASNAFNTTFNQVTWNFNISIIDPVPEYIYGYDYLYKAGDASIVEPDSGTCFVALLAPVTQPILKNSYDYLTKFLNEAYEIMSSEANKINEMIYSEETTRFFRAITLLVGGAAALAGLRFFGKKLHENCQQYYRDRRFPPSLDSKKRLAKIGYSEDNIPHDFLCPILLEIMDEPVKANDNKTYERSALERWCRSSDKRSPLIPSITIDMDKVTPDFEIREEISKFILNAEKEDQNNVISIPLVRRNLSV
ncbi:MAG: U-box domain-containing protein [Gammaproteobacteria bacterium]|nr:U-box domain-containing protein [Gammaproteobacteria bacterium]